MFGAIAGDIIGSRYEFNDHKSKKFDLFGNDLKKGRCAFTDDTVMTVAVAAALLGFKEIENEDKFKSFLIDKMHLYGNRYPDAGYGARFSEWLTYKERTPYNSWGNGSAMRVSPVGWYARSLEDAERIAKLTAEVTHDHPEGIKGAQSVAAAIWIARHGGDKKRIKEYIEKKYYPDGFKKSLDEIRPGYRFDVSCQGSVPEAFQSFFEAKDYEDTVRNAVSLGGDSDTIAAIAGGIAEAYFKIPKDIKKKAMGYLTGDLQKIVLEFSEKYMQDIT